MASTGGRVARYFAMSRLALAASLSRLESGAVEDERALCANDTEDAPARSAAAARRRVRSGRLSIGSDGRAGEAARPLRGLLAPDLGDLAVPLAGQPLLVAAEIVVQPLDVLVGGGAGQSSLVQDVQLRHFGGVKLAGVGDGRLLLFGERAVVDARFLVLLAEALHCQLVRALRSLVGHGLSVAEVAPSLFLPLSGRMATLDSSHERPRSPEDADDSSGVRSS